MTDLALLLSGAFTVIALLGLLADAFVLRAIRRSVSTAPKGKGTTVTLLENIQTTDRAYADQMLADATVRVDVPDPSLEDSARQAVKEVGVTGRDADRLFHAIMEGIAKAKAQGSDSGTIAISMTPSLSLTKVLDDSPKPKGHSFSITKLNDDTLIS